MSRDSSPVNVDREVDEDEEAETTPKKSEESPMKTRDVIFAKKNRTLIWHAVKTPEKDVNLSHLCIRLNLAPSQQNVLAFWLNRFRTGEYKLEPEQNKIKTNEEQETTESDVKIDVITTDGDRKPPVVNKPKKKDLFDEYFEHKSKKRDRRHGPKGKRNGDSILETAVKVFDPQHYDIVRATIEGTKSVRDLMTELKLEFSEKSHIYKIVSRFRKLDISLLCDESKEAMVALSRLSSFLEAVSYILLQSRASDTLDYPNEELYEDLMNRDLPDCKARAKLMLKMHSKMGDPVAGYSTKTPVPADLRVFNMGDNNEALPVMIKKGRHLEVLVDGMTETVPLVPHVSRYRPRQREFGNFGPADIQFTTSGYGVKNPSSESFHRAFIDVTSKKAPGTVWRFVRHGRWVRGKGYYYQCKDCLNSASMVANENKRRLRNEQLKVPHVAKVYTWADDTFGVEPDAPEDHGCMLNEDPVADTFEWKLLGNTDGINNSDYEECSDSDDQVMPTTTFLTNPPKKLRRKKDRTAANLSLQMGIHLVESLWRDTSSEEDEDNDDEDLENMMPHLQEVDVDNDEAIDLRVIRQQTRSGATRVRSVSPTSSNESYEESSQKSKSVYRSTLSSLEKIGGARAESAPKGRQIKLTNFGEAYKSSDRPKEFSHFLYEQGRVVRLRAFRKWRYGFIYRCTDCLNAPDRSDKNVFTVFTWSNGTFATNPDIPVKHVCDLNIAKASTTKEEIIDVVHDGSPPPLLTTTATTSTGRRVRTPKRYGDDDDDYEPPRLDNSALRSPIKEEPSVHTRRSARSSKPPVLAGSPPPELSDEEGGPPVLDESPTAPDRLSPVSQLSPVESPKKAVVKRRIRPGDVDNQPPELGCPNLKPEAEGSAVRVNKKLKWPPPPHRLERVDHLNQSRSPSSKRARVRPRSPTGHDQPPVLTSKRAQDQPPVLTVKRGRGRPPKQQQQNDSSPPPNLMDSSSRAVPRPRRGRPPGRRSITWKSIPAIRTDESSMTEEDSENDMHELSPVNRRRDDAPVAVHDDDDDDDYEPAPSLSSSKIQGITTRISPRKRGPQKQPVIKFRLKSPKVKKRASKSPKKEDIITSGEHQPIVVMDDELDEDAIQKASTAHNTTAYGIVCTKDNCNLEVESVEDLRDHIILVHMPDYRPYKCGFCVKKFVSQREMINHYDEHHADEDLADCQVTLNLGKEREVDKLVKQMTSK